MTIIELARRATRQLPSGLHVPFFDLTGTESLELCAGIGGLALSTEFVTGAKTTLVAEVHPEACKIMAKRFPNARNLGDAKKIDWEQYRGKTQVVSAGFPCQDISQAGTREGIKGMRSGLWFDIATGLWIMRPEHVFLENVAAIRTRGLYAVLGSLHEMKYNAWWGILGADDVGACHIRKRWFCYAEPSRHARRSPTTIYGTYDPDTHTWRTPQHDEIGDSKSCKHLFTKWGSMRDGELSELEAPANATRDAPSLPTVRAADGGRGPTLKSTVHQGSDDLVTVLTKLFRRNPSVYEEHPEWLGAKPTIYLKTPTAYLGSSGAAQHPDQRKAGKHGPTLDDEVCFLLNVRPEDEAGDGPFSPAEWWNEFLPAVRRWECLSQSAAPIPVIRGPRGGVKVNPRFVEWMMGLPEGWATEVEGVSLGEQISRIGNGVMPLQSVTSFVLLLQAKREHEAAEMSGVDDEPKPEIEDEDAVAIIKRVDALLAEVSALMAEAA